MPLMKKMTSLHPLLGPQSLNKDLKVREKLTQIEFLWVASKPNFS
jgi:hypothetical protein